VPSAEVALGRERGIILIPIEAKQTKSSLQYVRQNGALYK
jgi:hypothetical protein